MTLLFSESQFPPTRECVRTGNGIEIGRSYVPPPQPLGSQAELVQRALLGDDTQRLGHRLVTALSLVGLCAVIAALLAGAL